MEQGVAPFFMPVPLISCESCKKKKEVYSHRMRYTSILTFHQTITSICLLIPAEVQALHRFACRHKQKLQRQVCELREPAFH